MRIAPVLDKILNRETPYFRWKRLVDSFVVERNLQEGHFFGNHLSIRMENILTRPIKSVGLESVREIKDERKVQSFLGDFFEKKRRRKGIDRLRTILTPVLSNPEGKNEYIKGVLLEFNYNFFQDLMDLCNNHPDMRAKRANFTPSSDRDYVQLLQDSLEIMISSVDQLGLAEILGTDILSDYRRILERFKQSDPVSVIDLTSKLVAFKTYAESSSRLEQTFFGSSVFNGFSATMDFLHKTHALFVGRHGAIDTSTSPQTIDDK